MQQSKILTGPRGITFTVDNVKPAIELLPECRIHEALDKNLNCTVVSCSDYHASVVENIGYHPLLAAVYTAFATHRPLVLSPDAVWITIAQGIAYHMVVHADRLRSKFVSHKGQLDLVFNCDWPRLAPENPWPEAFASWAGQIRDHVGAQVHDVLVCDFSTTSPVERTVSQIVMMDIFERYFKYVVLCVCGIPTVTLEGTPADWERLENKVGALEMFEIDWWLKELKPICRQFVRASKGDIDLGHWQNICKLKDEYGGVIVNGWIARLFPYLRSVSDGPCNKKNNIFETGDGFQTHSAPSGLSQIPFVWRNSENDTEHAMQAIGGFVGMTQDPQTLALRPKVGWAVRRASAIENVIHIVEKRFGGVQAGGKGGRISQIVSEFPDMIDDAPPDLGTFYTRFGQLEMKLPSVAISFLPPAKFEKIVSGATLIWYRFADCSDGSWLAFTPHSHRSHDFMCPLDLQKAIEQRGADFSPICRVAGGSYLKKDISGHTISLNESVVAISFTELVQKTLETDGINWMNSPPELYGKVKQYI